jgi:phenylpyruvate tautomerase PptA (4-oxalocrotonate tautomerase family)
VCFKKRTDAQKKHEIAIATKKTVAKHTGKKIRLQKNQFKKSSIT